MTFEQKLPARNLRWRSTDSAVIHVQFAGRSFDISMIGLDLRPTSGDDLVKREIADYLAIEDERLDNYVIDRHLSGNLTIRPQGVFGCLSGMNGRKQAT